MLIEWFRHRLASADPAVKKLGYVKELIAIEARHKRCAKAWAEHLCKTRRFVLWSAANCRPNVPNRKVTVYGSGLLLDVPIKELAADYDEVVLVDICHLPQVREKVIELSNVRLVEADITGLADDLAAGREPDAPPPAPLPDADADLVVSLNLLAQLPLVPCQRLKRADRERFGRRIMERHLEALGALPAQVTLLTETKRRWLEAAEVIHEDDPLMGIRLPETGSNMSLGWEWNIAPQPEIAPTRDMVLDVAAYSDLFKNWTFAAP